MQAPRAVAGELAGAARRISLPRVLREHGVAIALGTLVLVQWLAILAFALTVRHNGWLYYQGGDQLWSLHDRLVPRARRPPVHGGRLRLAVRAPADRRGRRAAVPRRAAGDRPARTCSSCCRPRCSCAVRARRAARRAAPSGSVAATLWVVPRGCRPALRPGLPREVRRAVPAAGDGPHGDVRSPRRRSRSSWRALLTARALDAGRRLAGAAAGLGAGLAVAMKPSVALALPAFALAPAVARRWRSLFGGVLALAVPLLVLASGRRAASATCRVRRRARRTSPRVGSSRRSRGTSTGASRSCTASSATSAASSSASACSSCSRWAASSPSPGERLPGATLVGGWFLLIVRRPGGLTAVVDRQRLVLPLRDAGVPGLLRPRRVAAPARPDPRGRLAAAPRAPRPSRRASIDRRRGAGVVLRRGPRSRPRSSPVASPVTVVGRNAAAHPGRRRPRPADQRRRPPHQPPLERCARDERGHLLPRLPRAGRRDGVRGQGEGCARTARSRCGPSARRESPSFSEEPPEAGRWVYRVSVAANWLDDQTQGDPTVISQPVEVTTG